jgi:hypothetical protein
MAEANRLAAALSYEQDRPAFGNPSMMEQGRKMRERKQAEQVDRSAQNVKSDLLARALMYRYNPETLIGLTDTPGPQTLDEAAGLDPKVTNRTAIIPNWSRKEGWTNSQAGADFVKLMAASDPRNSHLMQPEEAMPLATNLMGGGVVASRLAPAPAGSLGMNVWHGSPHRFDKFDMSKIGTGEGAQAYGHGLYFAENPAVAKEYSRMNVIGSQLDNLSPSAKKFISEQMVFGKDQKTISALADSAKVQAKAWDAEDVAKGIAPSRGQYSAAMDEAINFLSKNEVKPNNGNLYKVDLPDEQIAKMLDWDKPLGGQHPDVQAALAKIDKDTYHPQGGDYGADEQGQMIYMRLANSPLAKTYADASELLRSAGIPGIRYLDGGSRTGGAGTSNFVAFDDKIPKIIGRE